MLFHPPNCVSFAAPLLADAKLLREKAKAARRRSVELRAKAHAAQLSAARSIAAYVETLFRRQN
jgi:hypothetical protein